MLTPDPAQRAGRALAAAQAKVQAGASDAALDLLARAEAGPLSEFQHALVDLVRAQVAFAASRGSDASPLLLRAARRLEPIDADLSRATYLDALGLFGRAQHILPAFRIWAAQLILPALWIWPTELILILCPVGAAQLILPALRIWPAKLILMFRSVGAAQQISWVLRWLRPARVTCHLDLLMLDMRRESSVISSGRRDGPATVRAQMEQANNAASIRMLASLPERLQVVFHVAALFGGQRL
jgi:hypothetical protein